VLSRKDFVDAERVASRLKMISLAAVSYQQWKSTRSRAKRGAEMEIPGAAAKITVTGILNENVYAGSQLPLYMKSVWCVPEAEACGLTDNFSVTSRDHGNFAKGLKPWLISFLAPGRKTHRHNDCDVELALQWPDLSLNAER